MSSDYPNGFTSGLTIRGLPINVTHPGEVFFVNNSGVLPTRGKGGQAGHNGTYRLPYDTIANALNAGTASRGDVIFAMPGHTETITTDGGLALNKAGVAVIGLGSGSLRPKIVLDTAAAAAITATAANMSLKNFVVEASFADITNAIDVTATDFTLDAVEFQEEGANLNFLDIIACTGADNTADGLWVENCRSFSIDAGINSFINVTGDLDRLVCRDNLVVHDNANALAMILCATGKDLTNCDIGRNKYSSLKASGDLLIDNDTTNNSGMVYDNLVSHADVTGEVLVDCDGVGLFNNYASGVITASGYLLPAADS